MLLWLFVVPGNVVHAQSGDPKPDQLAVEVGPHLGYLRDINFSPLNYRETGIVFSLAYSHRNKKDNLLFTADVDYMQGKLKTDVSDYFTTNMFLANLELSLLFKLSNSAQRKLLMFAGPQYNSFFQYAQWGTDRESWTYLMAHGLNIKGLAMYRISARSSIQSSLSIPVISNFVRPPYNGFDQYIVDHSEKVMQLSFRGETASFDKYVAFDWKTTYCYDTGEHLSVLFRYLARYQYVPGVNKVVQFQNQLTAGVLLRW